MQNRSKSRRHTPWDGEKDVTATQEFLRTHYHARYEERHPALQDAGETALINAHRLACCPYCGSGNFISKGYDSLGVQRYQCACGRNFKPTTGTIFDSRKISISEWIEYCLNIFRYISLNADSWNNRNAISTSKYWLEKLFLTLDEWQDDIILGETVWLDETYYSVLMRDRERNESGHFLRGISRNQICIGVATDKTNTICYVEGFARPSQEASYQTFKSHLKSGSTLIHDKEKTHRKLVAALDLKSKAYKAADLRGLADSENPLNPVNRIHCLLKMFLNAHSGFNRKDLQAYLNLYAFVINPPFDHLEKVEKIIEMAFNSPKGLKYRDQFTRNKND